MGVAIDSMAMKWIRDGSNSASAGISNEYERRRPLLFALLLLVLLLLLLLLLIFQRRLLCLRLHDLIL